MVAGVNHRSVDVSQSSTYGVLSGTENEGSRSNVTADVALLQDQCRLLQNKLKGLFILKVEKDDACEPSEDRPEWMAVEDRVYKAVEDNADQIVKRLQSICRASGFDISSSCIVRYLVRMLLQKPCDLDLEMVTQLNRIISEEPLLNDWQCVIYDLMYFHYQHVADLFKEINTWMDNMLISCSSLYPPLLGQEVATLEGNHEKISIIFTMMDTMMHSLMNQLNDCWWLIDISELSLMDVTNGISSALNGSEDSLYIMAEDINNLCLFRKSSSTEKLSMERNNCLNKNDPMVAMSSHIKQFQQDNETFRQFLLEYLKGTYSNFCPARYKRPENRYQLSTRSSRRSKTFCHFIIAVNISITFLSAVMGFVVLILAGTYCISGLAFLIAFPSLVFLSVFCYFSIICCFGP